MIKLFIIKEKRTYERKKKTYLKKQLHGHIKLRSLQIIADYMRCQSGNYLKAQFGDVWAIATDKVKEKRIVIKKFNSTGLTYIWMEKLQS